jgi:hypothetical protein
MFLRNVGLSLNYKPITTQKTALFIFTAARTRTQIFGRKPNNFTAEPFA